MLAIIQNIAFFALVLVAFPSGAADQQDELKLGFRIDAPPFASEVSAGSGSLRFEGYSVELCRRFAAYLRAERIKEVPVPTAADRFDMLRSKDIDILCGATTATLYERAAFSASLYIFVTGASVLLRENLGSDDEPLRVGYLRGTTGTELVIAERERLRSILEELQKSSGRLRRQGEPRVLPLTSHNEAIARLQEQGSKGIDVYVADEPILDALLDRARMEPNGAQGVARDRQRLLLSVEPYALLMRRDDPRRLALDCFLQGIFRRDEFFDLLAKYFGNRVLQDFLDLARLQQAIPIGGAVQDDMVDFIACP